MKSNLKYVGIAAGLLLLAVAIYFSMKDNTPPAASETAATADLPPAVDGDASLYLTLSDMKGNAVAMDTSKLIFLNVWATWCGPCNAEMPSIQSLYERYKENPRMAFYIVSDENPSTVQNFLQKKDYQLPFYLFNGSYPGPLNGDAIPRSYLVRNGKVLAEQIGAIDWSNPEISQFIDQQLAL
ncbi:TlpA family protein disulfide reductase [Arundinibacter roseus]|uniref:TlpA family protein disulfide reductase n=1 Tax=Arundinibacter roseus TaxID=2070510 RepID=A0A4R4KFE6_9BACT|nr:TlpA disulfide reductase family protein [Arundinibacter roseus]TDB65351.1 TlpA family protein disulfide reductase [Arundinibacter roseus]